MHVSGFDLSGRVAIITGGNGGIGLGMADALARAGCSVSIGGATRKKRARPKRAACPWRRRRRQIVRRQRPQKLSKPPSRRRSLSSVGSMRVSLMPELAVGDGEASSIAPRRNGGACLPSISIAYSTFFNLPSAI